MTPVWLLVLWITFGDAGTVYTAWTFPTLAACETTRTQLVRLLASGQRGAVSACFEVRPPGGTF